MGVEEENAVTRPLGTDSASGTEGCDAGLAAARFSLSVV
jgi:hypothetical protein